MTLRKIIDKVCLENLRLVRLPRLLDTIRKYNRGHVSNNLEKRVAEMRDIVACENLAKQIPIFLKQEIENPSYDEATKLAYRKALSYTAKMRAEALPIALDYQFYFFQDLGETIDFGSLIKLVEESRKVDIAFSRECCDIGIKNRKNRAHIIDDDKLIQMGDKELALFTLNHIDIFFPVFYDYSPTINRFGFVHKEVIFSRTNFFSFEIGATNRFFNCYHQVYEQKTKYEVKITCKK